MPSLSLVLLAVVAVVVAVAVVPAVVVAAAVVAVVVAAVADLPPLSLQLPHLLLPLRDSRVSGKVGGSRVNARSEGVAELVPKKG